MQKIVPFLWFDNQAVEAADLYTSIFPNSKLGTVSRYGEGSPGQPGTVMSVSFELEGLQFHALNGGPLFKFTPSVSFFVGCETPEEIDALWKSLSEGGTVRMELQAYPFSDRFGWVADRYGLNWQLNLSSRTRSITPLLMFAGEQDGMAVDAMQKYTSIFGNSSTRLVERYSAGEPGQEGNVKHASFLLAGQEFMAMDGGPQHQFGFTEAISLFVNCETQQEVDELWEKLTEGGEESQCAWLKDRYGVSWQIVPIVLGQMLGDPDPVKARRVMEAMLQMRKIDIAALRRAYDNR